MRIVRKGWKQGHEVGRLESMTQKGGVRVVMRTEWRRISENLGEEYVVVEDI